MKSLTEINKAIALIKTSGEKLDKLIQETAVSVLEHFAEHKDNGLVNRLYLAMPAGSRKTAMTSWLLAYGALAANTDNNTKKEQPFILDRDKATDPVAAALDMWYSHKPDNAPDKVFDLQKAVRGMIAKAMKAETVPSKDRLALRSIALAAGLVEPDWSKHVQAVAKPIVEAAPEAEPTVEPEVEAS
jgi:hypothetical protein